MQLAYKLAVCKNKNKKNYNYAPKKKSQMVNEQKKRWWQLKIVNSEIFLNSISRQNKWDPAPQKNKNLWDSDINGVNGGREIGYGPGFTGWWAQNA